MHLAKHNFVDDSREICTLKTISLVSVMIKRHHVYAVHVSDWSIVQNMSWLISVADDWFSPAKRIVCCFT